MANSRVVIVIIIFRQLAGTVHMPTRMQPEVRNDYICDCR